MTLSSLSYMWYLWILTKVMNDVMPFFLTTKAYVEFIGRVNERAYLQYIYIVKSNFGSK
jgi:hypothetical protein